MLCFLDIVSDRKGFNATNREVKNTHVCLLQYFRAWLNSETTPPSPFFSLNVYKNMVIHPLNSSQIKENKIKNVERKGERESCLHGQDRRTSWALRWYVFLYSIVHTCMQFFSCKFEFESWRSACFLNLQWISVCVCVYFCLVYNIWWHLSVYESVDMIKKKMKIWRKIHFPDLVEILWDKCNSFLHKMYLRNLTWKTNCFRNGWKYENGYKT